MIPQKFSKKEAISFGWQTMKDNFWFFVVLLTIIALIIAMPEIILHFVKDILVLVIFINIVSVILSLIIDLGLYKISLKFYDKEKVKLSDLFACWPLLFKYLIATILYILIVTGGSILLIVPGIIWGIKYQFYGYLIVDKGLRPIAALKKSGQITKGAKWNLFLLGLLFAGITILGILILIIGLFAALPTILIASAFVYRKLLAFSKVPEISSEVSV